MTTTLTTPDAQPLASPLAQRLAEIQARAAARGLTVKRAATLPPANKCQATARHLSGQRPTAPNSQPRVPRCTQQLDAATLRSLPNAWRRVVAQDYDARERQNILRNLETELTARLIARCLGPAWTVDAAETRGRAYLRHRPTAARIFFATAWNSDDRFRASTDHRANGLASEITMSRDRSPASLAADIARRIINAGLFTANSNARQDLRDRRDQETADKLAVLRMARQSGGQITPTRWGNSHGPRCRAARDGLGVLDFTCDSYHGYQLELCSANLDFLAAVAQVFRQFDPSC